MGNTTASLHLCAARNDIPTAMQLLESGKLDVNACYEAKTPLHIAAENGHSEMCELLCSHRANVDARDSLGQTPLLIAAVRGHPKTCQKLLVHDANPNIVDDRSRTALMWAALNGYCETVTELLSHGADYSTQSHLTGGTALMCAAKGNIEGSAASTSSEGARIQCLEALIDAGADLNQIDKNGHTAVNWASSRTIRELLSHARDLQGGPIGNRIAIKQPVAHDYVSNSVDRPSPVRGEYMKGGGRL